MAPRSLFQRFIDRTLEAASNALESIDESLSRVVESAPPPASQQATPTTPPVGPRRGRSRPRQDESRLEQLERLVRQQAETIELLRREIAQQPPPPPPQLPDEKPPPRPRYPRRILGRLPPSQWTPDHLRGRFPTRNSAEVAYAEINEEGGVPPSILAVVQESATGPFVLYVGES